MTGTKWRQRVTTIMKTSNKSVNQEAKNSFSIKGYFLRHIQVCLASLGRICRSPVSSLMTIAVIAISLALPAGMHVLIKNIEYVTSGWDGAAQISLFIKKGTTEEKVVNLKNQIELMGQIDKTEYISPTSALEEFKRLSGFGQALDALDKNPLPAVIVISPGIEASSPQQLNQLVESLQDNPIVDHAQLDMQWVKRLYSIMDIINRGVMIVGALLALAVILITGNTIRLDIQNRHDEILITKLIGATNSFIRRPFLYTGILYGLLGGIIASVLIGLSIGLLSDSVSKLSSLYSSGFELKGLGVDGTFTLIAGSTALGFAGSWVAVGKHLGKIEPS
ncbi:MAG: cell division protein FtsX [Gammaproteobacteria bacterium]|nr:MAG: cell division protein FtsX [Gammaproteobacteria bacterium]